MYINLVKNFHNTTTNEARIGKSLLGSIYIEKLHQCISINYIMPTNTYTLVSSYIIMTIIMLLFLHKISRSLHIRVKLQSVTNFTLQSLVYTLLITAERVLKIFVDRTSTSGMSSTHVTHYLGAWMYVPARAWFFSAGSGQACWMSYCTPGSGPP